MATLIPEPAHAMPGPFHPCPECGRVYWPGSHSRRMRALLIEETPEWAKAD